MTEAMIEDWLKKGEENGELAALEYISPAAIRRQTPLRLPVMQQMAGEIFGRFAGVCLERGKT
jgi:hypothetical protein